MDLVTAKEAARMMGLTPTRFLEVQDSGRITPEILDGRTFYSTAILFGAMRRPKRNLNPNPFPLDLYATAKEAIEILQVCRKTFYSRVNAGSIQIHKHGIYSFVLRKDLYANDDLF